MAMTFHSNRYNQILTDTGRYNIIPQDTTSVIFQDIAISQPLSLLIPTLLDNLSQLISSLSLICVVEFPLCCSISTIRTTLQEVSLKIKNYQLMPISID